MLDLLDAQRSLPFRFVQSILLFLLIAKNNRRYVLHFPVVERIGF